MDVGGERGKGAVNERSSRRMLRSVAVWLFGLPNSFPSHDSTALSCYFGAVPELDVRSRRKNNAEIERESLGRGMSSLAIKMSERSL